MACNREGEIYPETLCKVGHICLGGVMSGAEVKQRSCHLVVEFGDTDPCENGIRYYYNSSYGNSAKTLYKYFYN